MRFFGFFVDGEEWRSGGSENGEVSGLRSGVEGGGVEEGVLR